MPDVDDDRPRGVLGKVIQRYLDRQPFPPSRRRVAARLGVSPSTLANWERGDVRPSTQNLRALADAICAPYHDVFYAAMVDAGYLTKTEAEDHLRRTGTNDYQQPPRRSG